MILDLSQKKTVQDNFGFKTPLENKKYRIILVPDLGWKKYGIISLEYGSRREKNLNNFFPDFVAEFIRVFSSKIPQ